MESYFNILITLILGINLLFIVIGMVRRRKILIDKKNEDFHYSVAMSDFFHQNNKELELSCYSEDNEVDIFITAKDKYRQLIKDIESAQKSIHLLYFIIRNDRIGRTIIELLAKKAKQGVEVRVLYDYAGCLLTPCETFRPLLNSGAQVESFFPLKLGNYLRLNFRNHRKLVIIDNSIGYLGGMNIGDEYMGFNFEGVPWRDTHLRVTGSCVQFLQLRFINDWRFATKYRIDEGLEFKNLFFPSPESKGNTKVRIVSGGPDIKDEEIKWHFLKMIYDAKEKICIQTPYFVPDETFLEALKIAAFSGVKVMIMAPEKSDNFIAQKVSLSYLGILLTCGVEVYLYPGFLHAKMILIDNKAVSIGSTNMDMRSFYLNFEVNAFLSGNDITKRCADIFEQDLLLAEKMISAEYEKRPYVAKIEESIFRIFAPFL